MDKNEISDGRKMVFYSGIASGIAGFVTFMSIFVSAATNFGNFDNFDGQVASYGLRAVVGMGMMISGSVLVVVGKLGTAGSGVLLDPEQAREDLKPWNHMTGGMIKDTLDGAGIDLERFAGNSPKDRDFAARLRELHALHEEGILTEEEYAREKAEILENN